MLYVYKHHSRRRARQQCPRALYPHFVPVHKASHLGPSRLFLQSERRKGAPQGEVAPRALAHADLLPYLPAGHRRALYQGHGRREWERDRGQRDRGQRDRGRDRGREEKGVMVLRMFFQRFLQVLRGFNQRFLVHPPCLPRFAPQHVRGGRRGGRRVGTVFPNVR